MSLPRLRDADPAPGRQPPKLPAAMQHELEGRVFASDHRWVGGSSDADQDVGPVAVLTLLSFTALTVAIVALAVALIAVRGIAPSNDGDSTLILGRDGRDVINCVSDSLQIFVPESMADGRPPDITLKSGGVRATVIPKEVEGGYYIALPAWQGKIAIPGSQDTLSIRAGQELIVRIGGESTPRFLDVHGLTIPGKNGAEQCQPVTDRPPSR